MFFLINNLTIFVITIIVIFCKPDDDVKECINELINVGFDINDNGFNNLYKINTFLIYNPRRRLDKEQLKDYKQNVISHISYEFPKKTEQKIVYGNSYINELGKHVLNTKSMLSITTWCSINANTTMDVEEFSVNKPYTQLTEKISNIQYARRIARNIGMPKSYQVIGFKTIKVCHEEVSTTLAELKINLNYYAYKKVKLSYYELYHNYNNVLKLDPLNWCAINVCYVTLTTAGFENVSAEENIEIINLLKKTISETADEKYYDEDSEENIYNIVSPYDSRILSQSQYPINWCGINVCFDDLIEAGFVYEYASDNYAHVFSEICFNTETPFNKFAMAYCGHLAYIVNSTNRYVVKSDKPDSAVQHIPANFTPRNPWDFCTLTVINLDVPHNAENYD
ncbi:uncharacterized protein LOC113555940 [Rhopalosiphum maidis]|uniref:uncharacterized protein LOC113555940 n=1 Tax=Rhopalosiphum maidis TaxID=43146 RepID=UPI000F009EB4|nr:uncharacterized protein LOC113555940 [Rhopalosiphum maidis]